MSEKRASRWAMVLTGALVCSAPPMAGAPVSWTTPVAQAAEVQNVDELLVVDCLLPGQIRRLGRQVTTLSPRRPMKTTARDCEIRGGEYVSYDRANYQTALKVWEPLAKGGDPSAQTYVGEIYEKGLGVQPNFTTAAEWYRRAAEKGFSRAAINLGNLYERGQGVPQDSREALNWYRRAAGLGDLNFPVAAPAAPSPGAAEMARLEKENRELRRQLTASQAELERAQRELDGLRRGLEQRRSEADAERAEVARLRKEIETVRAQGSGAPTSALRDLERAVAERETRLAAKDRETAELRAALTQREKEATERRVELDRLRQQASNVPPSIEVIEPTLVAEGGTRDITPTGTGLLARVDSLDRVLLVGRVVSAGGVKAVTVNGREAPLDPDNMFKTQVPLKRSGERIQITAIDRGGRKSTVDFLIIDRSAPQAPASGIGFPPPRKPLQFGTYYALVIGNNDYKNLKRLHTAVNDAKDVADILEKIYGFKVTTLLNATRYDILSALNKLREQLTEKDNLLIYYAGHGELDKVNQRGHWLPIDAEPNSTANWISNVAVTDILNAMTVRQVLVVADSCYSGTLTRSTVAQLEGGLTDEKRLELMELMAQKRSRMVLSSGGVEPVLDSAGGSHSVFAQAFIELLQKNRGVLPGQETFRLLQQRVQATALNLNVSQVPEYAPIKFAGHEAGDFFFVRVASN